MQIIDGQAFVTMDDSSVGSYPNCRDCGGAPGFQHSADCRVVSPVSSKPKARHRCNDPTCVSCRNRRNRRNGKARQKRVADKLGVAGANEETWTHPLFRVEVKSGSQVPKRVLDAHDQSERARATGDSRPVMTVWVPSNTRKRLAIVDFDALLAVLDDQGPANAYRIRELARKGASLLDDIAKLAR